MNLRLPQPRSIKVIVVGLILALLCCQSAAKRRPKECYKLEKNGTLYERKTIKCQPNQDICKLQVVGSLAIALGCAKGKASECDLNKDNSFCGCNQNLCEIGNKHLDEDGLDMNPNLILGLTVLAILGGFLICAIFWALIGLCLGCRHKKLYSEQKAAVDPTMINLYQVSGDMASQI